jgi:peptidoglycan-associated lipoprotein
MKRAMVVAVLAVGGFTGCVHKAAAVAVAPVNETKARLSKPWVPDGTAAVEKALKYVKLTFAFDQDILEPEALWALQKFAPILRKHRDVKVMIAGNCDERGTEEYNLLLGQRRAEAARAYLVALGVRDEQLDTITFGADRPLSVEHTEEAWALNRRDDLSVRAQLSASDEPMDYLW